MFALRCCRSPGALCPRSPVGWLRAPRQSSPPHRVRSPLRVPLAVCPAVSGHVRPRSLCGTCRYPAVGPVYRRTPVDSALPFSVGRTPGRLVLPAVSSVASVLPSSACLVFPPHPYSSAPHPTASPLERSHLLAASLGPRHLPRMTSAMLAPASLTCLPANPGCFLPTHTSVVCGSPSNTPPSRMRCSRPPFHVS